jgi:hypothetical protein
MSRNSLRLLLPLGVVCVVSLVLCVPANPQQVTAIKLGTNAACASSASPASCSADPAGFVVIAPGIGTVVVDTSAVTSSSQIFVQFDETLGTPLGVTCNVSGTSAAARYWISARTSGTSFTISTSANPTTNPACLSYLIVN